MHKFSIAHMINITTQDHFCIDLFKIVVNKTLHNTRIFRKDY